MAVRILSMVWDSYPGGGTELLALLALADWSDDEGRCWPSIAAIGKKTRLSRSQAQRMVHRLIDVGIVSVTGNKTGGAPGSTRQYRINLSKLTGRMDATPTGSTGATGSVNATGRMDAQEGSHGCAETGSTGATQTVSEPSTTVNRTQRARKTAFPSGFTVSDRVMAWATTKGYSDLDAHLEAFKSKCQAKGYTYADWDAAFMEAIREDWARLRTLHTRKRQPTPENFSSRDYGKGGRL